MTKRPTQTTESGSPVTNNQHAQTAGPDGPVLLQDRHLIEKLARFNRERIPERVVHAVGTGAYGYLEVTSSDVPRWTRMDVFSEVGKRTPVFVRFSTVAGSRGAPDTARDPRGFAIKLYTEDGNWDLVGNNTPIFFIRDGIKFPDFIHSQKYDPFTNRQEADNCLTSEEAERIGGKDPAYIHKDLYDAIGRGEFPSWTLKVQVMPEREAAGYRFNPFDLTKVWPYRDCPLITIGRLVLDRVPENFFAEVEQAACDPANMVPGIGPSPDRMLQARLFAYGDAQRYRLGINTHGCPSMHRRVWLAGRAITAATARCASTATAADRRITSRTATTDPCRQARTTSSTTRSPARSARTRTRCMRRTTTSSRPACSTA